MRLVIAMMKHETNTFSPIRTDWQRFLDWGAYLGDDARRAYEGTGMPMAAYLDLAAGIGAEIVTPIAAEAMPSGPVAAEAYERMSGAILEAVAKGCDAAMLDLHGAMVAETTPDGEGTLLERIRAIAPGLPIAVTCDLHANLSDKMVQNCTALIGYKTYPHVDMYAVGKQVGDILLRAIAGKIRPVMAWGSRPLLAQTLRMGTDDEPMKSLIARARDAEAHVAQAVARAKISAEGASGPVLLLDHADNTGSGGTQDVMTVIREVIRQDLADVAVGAVCDPRAVTAMQEAGVGATVTLKLGGHTDMPSIGLAGAPLEVSGRVRALSDGEWIVRGPMYTGVKVQMGPSAVLDTGKIAIVVVSRHHEPWDQGVFTSLGIDPKTKRFLVLKSRIHYRAGFAPIAAATVTCDGDGVTTSNYDLLRFAAVRRPIFPLDRLNAPPADDGVKDRTDLG